MYVFPETYIARTGQAYREHKEFRWGLWHARDAERRMLVVVYSESEYTAVYKTSHGYLNFHHTVLCWGRSVRDTTYNIMSIYNTLVVAVVLVSAAQAFVPPATARSSGEECASVLSKRETRTDNFLLHTLAFIHR
jgi:hypothetical protein